MVSLLGSVTPKQSWCFEDSRDDCDLHLELQSLRFCQSYLTVSKIDSFKVLQTIIIQGLKWKTNPDSVVKKSQRRIYFPFSYNWANSIWCRIWWFSSRRQSSSSTHPGVSQCKGVKRLQRIIWSAETVFEHYSEEQNCFSLSISVNVH